MPGKRIFLKSSELRWVQFDAKNSSLIVEFVSGGIYRYDGLPKTRYEALLAAESHGRHFNANIRGHYSYVQLS